MNLQNRGEEEAVAVDRQPSKTAEENFKPMKQNLHVLAEDSLYEPPVRRIRHEKFEFTCLPSFLTAPTIQRRTQQRSVDPLTQEATVIGSAAIDRQAVFAA